MADLETWMFNYGYDRIFRILIKRTPGDWTPREMEEKYIDESHYVDTHYTTIKIKEVIELPDKDVLIGYQSITEWKDLDIENPIIEYRKLSEIELRYFPEDEKEENWW